VRLSDPVAENRLLARWSALLGRSPAQRGGFNETDAELVPLGDGRLLALTVDTVDEEIRSGLYRSPETAGRVAAVAALSDLAAVGAEPIGLLLSVALPRRDRERTQAAVARGVREVCAAMGTYVLGGDTSDGATLAVSGVGAGLVPADGVLTRLGARPGDTVFVSGPLGAGAALAARRLLVTSSHDDWEAEWRPLPRLREGRLLRGVAAACMDTSDGLLATLDQLARLNRVAIRVTAPAAALLAPAAARARDALALPAFPFLAGQHGEYELAFTVPGDRRDALAVAAAAVGWQPLPIGVVEEGAGVSLGSLPIDGAHVRNLLGELGGDARAYARALCEMAPC
jgi:thiamine-monophosphate kinase